MKSKRLKSMVALAVAGLLLSINIPAYAATIETSENNNGVDAVISSQGLNIEDVSIEKEKTGDFVKVNNGNDTSVDSSFDGKDVSKIVSSVANSEVVAMAEDTVSEKATTEVDNTTVENAKGINLNTIDTGSMTEAGQQRWYLTYAPAGKVTAYLEYSSGENVDLNLHLFKYDANTGDITQVDNSIYGAGQAEQLSYVSTEDSYYFIGINSYEGYEENNSFSLAVVYSSTYDAAENDDNIYERQVISGVPDTLSQTIDNLFDVDWTEFNVTENKGIHIAFDYSGNEGIYQLELYDSSFNHIQTITQGNYMDGTFPKGTYYIKVSSQDLNYEAETPYTVKFVQYDNLTTRKKVTSMPKGYTDSIDNVYDQNWIEYTATDDVSTVATLVNKDNTTNYMLEVYTADADGNLVRQNSFSQNGHYGVSFKKGTTYYIRVSSEDGTYNPNSKYTINFITYDASGTLLDISNDGSYVITTNASNHNLYINGKIVKLDWKRERTINYGGGAYNHLSQSISTLSNTEINGASYGTYYSTHTGTVKNAVLVSAKNVSYFIYYYSYYNGQMSSDRYSDNMKLDFNQPLIIDADTCEAVDWASDANYHYVNNQEKYSFTQEK